MWPDLEISRQLNEIAILTKRIYCLNVLTIYYYNGSKIIIRNASNDYS